MTIYVGIEFPSVKEAIRWLEVNHPEWLEQVQWDS
jgi:hypothetical protein